VEFFYLNNIYKIKKGERAAFIKACIYHFAAEKNPKPNLPAAYGENAEWEKRRKLEKLTTKEIWNKFVNEQHKN